MFFRPSNLLVPHCVFWAPGNKKSDIGEVSDGLCSRRPLLPDPPVFFHRPRLDPSGGGGGGGWKACPPGGEKMREGSGVPTGARKTSNRVRGGPVGSPGSPPVGPGGLPEVERFFVRGADPQISGAREISGCWLLGVGCWVLGESTHRGSAT